MTCSNLRQLALAVPAVLSFAFGAPDPDLRSSGRALHLPDLLLSSSPHLLISSSPPQEPRAQPPWWERAPVVTSRYYRVKCDLPEDELRPLLNHLDHTFESYVEQLGWLRQNFPATFDVLIFADHKDYLTTLRFRYGVEAAGTGGMFFNNPQASALALWTGKQPRQRIEHVIQHEGFHQAAAALFGDRIPPWVNEGLAEFFGEAVMVGDRLVIGQTNPRVIEHIRHAIETDSHLPFRQMLTMDGFTWNARVQAGEARLQYEQAWSMVHFLIYGENGRYATMFSNYLRLLNVGHTSYDAFVRAFGTDDINAFEERWKEFAQKARPSSFVTAMERMEFLAAGLLELGRRKIHPESIEELRTQLRAIGFTYTLESHGYKVELSAEDDAMFTIPRDDLIGAEEPEPTFIMEKIPPRRIPVRERRLNLENPVPAMVKTQGVKPHELDVKWVRDLESNTFSFEIIVKR